MICAHGRIFFTEAKIWKWMKFEYFHIRMWRVSIVAYGISSQLTCSGIRRVQRQRLRPAEAERQEERLEQQARRRRVRHGSAVAAARGPQPEAELEPPLRGSRPPRRDPRGLNDTTERRTDPKPIWCFYRDADQTRATTAIAEPALSTTAEKQRATTINLYPL